MMTWAYGFDAVRSYLLGAKTIMPLRYEIVLVAFVGIMVPAGYAVQGG
jgi:hypothetical protein